MRQQSVNSSGESNVNRLEEDGKVLSPEELLYRCVHFINHTHDKVSYQVEILC